MPRETDSTTQYPANQVDPVDLSLVARIMGDDEEESIGYLLSLFQRTFPDVLDRLQIAIDEDLFGAVADAAHTAKGVAANAAAMTLENRLAALEEAASEGRMTIVRTLMQEVQIEASRVVSFMEAWKENKRSK